MSLFVQNLKDQLQFLSLKYLEIWNVKAQWSMEYCIKSGENFVKNRRDFLSLIADSAMIALVTSCLHVFPGQKRLNNCSLLLCGGCCASIAVQIDQIKTLQIQ